MKYVILKVENKEMGYDRVYPIIFPESLTHLFIAQTVKVAIEEDTRAKEVLVHSAGFCNVGAHGFDVYQHGSESLGIKSVRAKMDKDERILNMPNALQGMLMC